MKAAPEKQPKEASKQEYPLIGMTYKHYKGGTYVVNFMSRHTETEEVLVNYTSVQFGSHASRPLADWNKKTDTGESRFVLVGNKLPLDLSQFKSPGVPVIESSEFIGHLKEATPKFTPIHTNLFIVKFKGFGKHSKMLTDLVETVTVHDGFVSLCLTLQEVDGKVFPLNLLNKLQMSRKKVAVKVEIINVYEDVIHKMKIGGYVSDVRGFGPFSYSASPNNAANVHFEIIETE